MKRTINLKRGEVLEIKLAGSTVMLVAISKEDETIDFEMKSHNGKYGYRWDGVAKRDLDRLIEIN